VIAPHRLLVASPFSLRRDGLYGDARAIAHFMHRLAARHEIALVYLRASDEPPLDAQLAPELVMPRRSRTRRVDTLPTESTGLPEKGQAVRLVTGVE
jgi:hypothetical protein